MDRRHIVRGNIVLVVMVILSNSSLSPKLRLVDDFVFPLSQEEEEEEEEHPHQNLSLPGILGG